MAFRFPLAAVLRVRESIEQREERALQKLQLEVSRVARQIEELTTGIAQSHQALERALQTSIPASHVHSMLADVQSAMEKRQALFESLQTLERQRDEQSKVYQAAHRGREMLTGMQKQQREAYEVRQARAQQKNLDDIFIARRHRG
jgi:flagellar FliJ protein